ncbi:MULTISPECIES: Lrp/AsnC family transcriptional regulator [Arthrobacter]|uniref:Lrp/AsnC family transcriptional regulator n=1 Tax=Arthrobacter TaxID=1663 RepID=UPI0009F9A3C8|nr:MULTISPECIES: Lrp/AsnC family transcriptional regulator [Arthrobacter]UPO76285.1 Lrp/AsnC family transcriptional regulator [Arthrobacter sp. Helios]
MIDDIDREILRLLQIDGRMTATALASEVGLTVAPCHRRIKELERSGVLTGYRAVVDPAAVGLTFQALVFVTLRDRQQMLTFEDEVGRIEQIVKADRLFGEPDFLLKVIAADLAAYQQFYDEVLVGLPGVEKLTSTIVMKTVKEEGALPL